MPGPGRNEHGGQRLDRPCPECGEQLPAGKAFHIPVCADAHRRKIYKRYGWEET